MEDTLRRSDGDGIGQRAHIAIDCAPGNTGTHAFAWNFSLVSLPKARGVTASRATGALIVNVCVFDALHFGFSGASTPPSLGRFSISENLSLSLFENCLYLREALKTLDGTLLSRLSG